MDATPEKVKLKVTYSDSKPSYTFSKIKKTADSAEILDTATALAMLRTGTFEKFYKVVDTVITA